MHRKLEIVTMIYKYNQGKFRSPWISTLSDQSSPNGDTYDSNQYICIYVRICIDKVLILFHILVLWEYWGLTENRIALKLVLMGIRIDALHISSLKQVGKVRTNFAAASISEGSVFQII